MPAVTPVAPQSLPTVADATGAVRHVEQVATAVSSFEGAGFPVRRPFPGALDLEHTDPFLMLDQMGPIVYAPGEAVGAPDHPHRGFETVTYLIDGEMEHRDSYGGGGVIRGGDTQWMTVGAGLVHSEMPTEKVMREGGLLHGVQLWVNLPRADKRAEPRYQDITGDQLTLFRNDDGTASCVSSPVTLPAARDRATRTRRSRWRTPHSSPVRISQSSGRASSTRSCTCCRARDGSRDRRDGRAQRSGRGVRRRRRARGRCRSRCGRAARSAVARRPPDS